MEVRICLHTFHLETHKIRPYGRIFRISWRREGDSNSRWWKTIILDFESSAFNRSAISPEAERVYEEKLFCKWNFWKSWISFGEISRIYILLLKHMTPLFYAPAHLPYLFLSTSPMKCFLYLIVILSLASFALIASDKAWISPFHHTDVHYHANIALVIDGKKVDLNDPRYMEETTQCAIDPTKQRPEDRTHFHENNGDLVHVHAAWVTWGHLLSNIGWAFGQDHIVDDKGKMYQKNSSKSVRFVINGKLVDNQFNRLIASEDRLLVDYGDLSDEALMKTEFPKVAATAHEANQKDDPVSCGGSTWNDLLKRIQDMFSGH